MPKAIRLLLLPLREAKNKAGQRQRAKPKRPARYFCGKQEANRATHLRGCSCPSPRWLFLDFTRNEHLLGWFFRRHTLNFIPGGRSFCTGFVCP
jgi:hypothetical protein